MRTAAVGVSAYYALLFSAMGAQIPYWPLWLTAHGLTPQQVGLALAVTYFGRIVATPLTGALSDHWRMRKRLMIALAAGAAVAWAAFAVAPNVAAILVVTLIANGFWTGVMPLGETLALATVTRFGLHYGRVRLWGSITFIALSIGMGAILETQSVEWLVWVVAGFLALTAIACTQLTEVVPDPHEEPAKITDLLRDRGYVTFLAATAFNQISHTIYYGFCTLHWTKAGISPHTIGWLWSEGVVAEVLLFLFSRPVIERLGAKGLLMAGAVGGIVRWSVLGATTDLLPLFLVQILHATTFGTAHLGAMTYIQTRIDTRLTARAQGLYAAIACGAGPGIMALVSGRLYDAAAGSAFYAMALLSVLSLIACLKIANK